jgi:hypothetical protein
MTFPILLLREALLVGYSTEFSVLVAVSSLFSSLSADDSSAGMVPRVEVAVFQ